MQVVIDFSVLVGLLVPDDIWHIQAVALWSHIEKTGHTGVYFDCVAAEAISVAVRRLHEKKHVTEMDALLDQLNQRAPRKMITWIFPEVQRMYPTVIDLMRASKGAFNFNDALPWPAGNGTYRLLPVLMLILTMLIGCSVYRVRRTWRLINLRIEQSFSLGLG